MLRTAFLKYSLQARIGQMDGVFVAYHNTEEMFGFEYLPLETMEQDVFGNAIVPKQQFEMSISLIEKVIESVTYFLPKQDVELMISAPYKNNCYIYASPREGNGKQYAFQLTLVSTTNGVYTSDPYQQTADDEWRIYYDLKEIPFIQEEFLMQRKRIDQFLTSTTKSVGFSAKLKQKLYPDDVETP
jgi:hypothetical protein